MAAVVVMVLIFSFVAGSLSYVYKYRGNTRFTNFSEFVRKGWLIFTPLNCLLYLFTQKRARHSMMDLNEFPELAPIQNNWKIIRQEVLNLYENGYFDLTTKSGSGSSYDLGFRTFFKYGWSKFYLSWYGYTHNSAKRLCPKTVEILAGIPEVNGAMFSLLPVGSQLTRHLDPLAVSLRYHLGLLTPNSDDCFINVDGKDYSWRDGEAFMFDETYLHHAKNNSQQYRLILMCDITRPLLTMGPLINFFYKGFVKFTVVPNLEGDKQGLLSTVFSNLAPIIQKTKVLKQTNKRMYLAIKHTVNFTLLILAVGVLAGVINLLHSFGTMIIS
jgi:beta-hydroxylase